MYPESESRNLGNSKETKETPFPTEPTCWFNLPNLTFSEAVGEFYDVATDWNGQATSALVKIPEHSGKVHLECILPSGPFCCFTNDSPTLVCSDGSVYDCEQGTRVKQIDWSELIR